MSTNRILLWAVAGAALGTLLYRYLNSENGKQFLSTAGEQLRDITTKATDYAKNAVGGSKTEKQFEGDSVMQNSAY
jgi:hypothetical protein